MMIIKKRLALFVTVSLFVCGFAFFVWAEDNEDTDFKIEADVGYHFTDYNDYPGKVGEYNILDHDSTGPDMSISGTAKNKNLYLDFSGNFQGDDENEFLIKGEYRRILLQEFSYNSFEHWLDHDDLDNLCGKTGAVVVSHENFDVGKDYIIKYSEEKSDTIINFPFLAGTKINLNYRRQMREGHRQSMTLSHCGTCHVSSHAREIDEETEDFQAGITKKFSWLTVMYNYLHREFDEHGATPVNAYDDPIHPGGQGSIFDDRIQYGDETLEYDRVPSTEKDSHLAKIRATLPGATTLFASYIFSNVKNNDTSLEMDSNVISARLTNNFFPGLKLAGKFRYMSIDNDDVYVDVNEPLSVAGGNVGNIWNNPDAAYNSFDPDFIRESEISRDVTTLGFDARYQLLKRTSLNMGYEWEEVDRKDYAVEEGGDTETTTNTFKVGVTTRPFKKVKVKLGYKWQDIENPFNNVNGAYEDVIFPANSGIQYWERVAERTADLSNQPTKLNEITADIRWAILQNLSLDVNYRYTDKENDDTDVSNWKQESHVPSINLFYSPLAKLNINLSYIYDRTVTDTFTCIPVFNG